MTKILELLTSIKDNKYTTIIGAVAIAYGVYEVFKEDGDNQWGIGLIIIGAGFLFSKDGDKKDNTESGSVNETYDYRTQMIQTDFGENQRPYIPNEYGNKDVVQWGGFQNPEDVDCSHPECPKKH